MKKSIIRISSFVLVLILCISNLPFAYADGPEIFHGGTTVYRVNPWLGDNEFPQTHYAKQYASSSIPEDLVPPEEHVDTKEEAAAILREAFEAHTESITLYYATKEAPTEQGIFSLIEELIELSYAETDSPTEGDSLRYSWSGAKYGSYSGYQLGEVYYLTLPLIYSYYTTAEQEQELSEAVDALIASFGFTEATDQRTKIDAIYGYITDHVAYDYEHLNQNSYKLQFTAYAAMIHRTAVCQGYALLFYRLAEECGLDARVITGVGGTGRDANHAWNIVGLDQYYYYVDPTWDAERTTSAYEWYLKGFTDFSGHSNDLQFNTPEFNERYPIPQEGVYSNAYVGPYTFGEFEYYTNSTNAVITGYKGQGGDVVVPAKVNNIPVISVDTGTFYMDIDEKIKSITFSEGIRSMAPKSIEYCYGLKSIHFPSTMNLNDYGPTSFTDAPKDCHILETITVAEGNPYIKVVDGILYNIDMTTLLLCPALYPNKELVIPEGVIEIGNGSISNSVNIEKIVMPDTVERIWFWAFTTSTKLTEVNISNSCITIGQFAFSYTKVKSLHIPASVRNIMEDAIGTGFSTLESITVDPDNEFYRMENGALCVFNTLVKYPTVNIPENYIIPDGIENIEIGAFYGAKNLKKITFPEGLKQIENSAFSDCSSLEHITIPDTVTDIGKMSFVGCDMLISIIIPESVEVVDEDLCHPCDMLTVYSVSGSAAHDYTNSKPAFTFKEISEFTCFDGHQLGEEIIWETEFDKAFRYKCSVCNGLTNEHYAKIADDINEAEVVLEYTEIEYTGEVLQPKVLSVTFDGVSLVKDVDYILRYYDDGTYTGNQSIELEGIGKFAGRKIVQYYVAPKLLQNIEIGEMQLWYPYNGYPHQPQYFPVYINGEEISWENLYCVYENNTEVGVGTIYLKGREKYQGTVEIPFYIYPAATLLVKDLGGDENMAVSGGMLKSSGKIEVDLFGANEYTLRTFSFNGDVKVYADKAHNVPVAEGTTIIPDGGITNLYAVAEDDEGNPVEKTIELVTTQYYEYTDTLVSWAAPYIEDLNNTGLGLIKGDNENRFNGDGKLNRYQMAALLVRLQGTNKDLFAAEDMVFPDVPQDHWAENYVKAAYTVGLVNGIENTSTNQFEFQGTKVATRNQFFRLFVDVVVGDVDAYYEEHQDEIIAYVESKGFADLDAVADWAKPGTYSAIYLGYVEGGGADNNMINPGNAVTRYAAAVLLAKYLD